MSRKPSVFLLAAMSAVLGVNRVACQDLLTREVREHLADEWRTAPSLCLRALEIYGGNKTNQGAQAEAVGTLSIGQSTRVMTLYKVAAKQDIDKFFRALAGAYSKPFAPLDDPSCSSADQTLEYEFRNQLVDLLEAADAFKARGDLLGMQRLLRGTHEPASSNPSDPPPPRLESLLYCYAKDPGHLPGKVIEILGGGQQ